MREVLPLLSFGARHFLAIALATLLAFLAWTVAYALLLLVAILGNFGIGSPIAYPGGALLVVGVCLCWGCGVFAPACALGAGLCRLLALPRLAAIPIVFAAAFLLVLLHQTLFWHTFKALLIRQERPGLGESFADFLLFASLPLGVYWWATEGPGAVLEAIGRWFRRRGKRSSTAPSGTVEVATSETAESGDRTPRDDQKSPSS